MLEAANSHSSVNLKDRNVKRPGPVYEVSKGIRILRNLNNGHSCDALAKSLFALYLCHESLNRVKI